MGSLGALIMGFFGAVFASLTMFWQFDVRGATLLLPFAAFAAIALCAHRVLRFPGVGVVPSKRVRRTIAWSSIGEGIGLFVAGNLVMNLQRPDLLLPAMALVVGIHFVPIALVARFGPFFVLGAVLIGSAAIGAIVGTQMGGAIAGAAAAAALWIAAILALVRDARAKNTSR